MANSAMTKKQKGIQNVIGIKKHANLELYFLVKSINLIYNILRNI